MAWTNLNLTTSLGLTDFFCGAGGSSTGAVFAGAEVVSAANHWGRAIATHQHNHPHTRHYEVDLLAIQPQAFPYTPIAWFSPECTTHSRGRGKSVLKPIEQLNLWEQPDPADIRSRVTMWQVVRFAAHHRYEVVITENVTDISYWSPLTLWFQEMAKLGYEWKTCYHNAQFFNPVNGLSTYAPQSRDRWYTVFWRKGNRPPDLDFRPLAWCPRCNRNVRARQVFKRLVFRQGLYDNNGSRGQYYYACPDCKDRERGKQPGRVEPYYYAAWNAIDFSIPAPKIGEREQEGLPPLKGNTLRRICIGLEKYGDQPLVLEVAHSHAAGCRAKPTSLPLPTQTTQQTLAYLVPMKADPRYTHAFPSTQPLSTLTTVGAPGLLLAELYGNGACRSPYEPMNTVTAGGVKTALVLVPNGWLYSRYGCEDNQSGGDEPAPTVVCDNHPVLVMPQSSFVVSYYGGGDTVASVADALGTVTGRDRHALVSADHSANAGEYRQQHIPIEECRFRMLAPHECKNAQGFPDSYEVLGTRAEQVRQIGGAVPPPNADFLIRAVIKSLA